MPIQRFKLEHSETEQASFLVRFIVHSVKHINAWCNIVTLGITAVVGLLCSLLRSSPLRSNVNEP